VTYAFEQLGHHGFQDLAAALSIAAFGPSVQSMGRGPDAGRDMYCKGRLIWSEAAGHHEPEVWEGYTVFQVKSREAPSQRPADNASWLWGELRRELDAWASASSRSEVPDFVVVVSNVSLSPVGGTGGHDTIRQNVENYVKRLRDPSRDVDNAARDERLEKIERLSKIKKWRFWDRNQLTALLNRHAEVRQAFTPFLTALDVFAALAQLTPNIPLGNVSTAIERHARAQLSNSDGIIYFDEAGDDARGLSIDQVAIDIPVSYAAGKQRGTALGLVLERADHVLTPGITTQERPRHIVLTGAPGNGKTTLSKFLVHLFRTVLMRGSDELSIDQSESIVAANAALKRLGLALPRARRWSFRVDLADYAADGAVLDLPIVSWLAQKLSGQSVDGSIRPNILSAWMKNWPSLLVLDGLDEVTDANVRKKVIEQITALVNEAEADRADLLVVLTTRVTGYNDLAPTQFERVDLGDLTVADALRFGELAIRNRFGSDAERRDRTIRRLNEAAADENLRHLLRTPLQVLILTIIIESSGRVSPGRYALFNGYYDVIFRRERAKSNGLARILQEYGPHIDRLHEAIGIALQLRSAVGGDSNAGLSVDEVRAIARRVLENAEFDVSGRNSDLLDEIVRAATHRLVLIAPNPDDSAYGFDVRSLQELMAARFLTSGTDHDVRLWLSEIAASPHWRNTWVFAAGRSFDRQAHQRELVTSLVETIDRTASHRLGGVVLASPRLALDLIDDGMAKAFPGARRRLFALASHVLDEPWMSDLPSIARSFVRYAEAGDDESNDVAESIRDALVRSVTSQERAHELLEILPIAMDELEVNLVVRGLAAIRKRPDDADPAFADLREQWETFDEEIDTAPVDDEHRSELRGIGAILRSSLAIDKALDADIALLSRAIRKRELAPILDQGLRGIASNDPPLYRFLKEDVVDEIVRQPNLDTLQRLMDGTV
jgi:hypothetical protein